MQELSQFADGRGKGVIPLTFFSESSGEGEKAEESDFTFKGGKILINHELLNCINNIITKTQKYCFIVTPFLESLTKWVNLGNLFDEIYDDGKMLFFILKKPSDDFQDEREKSDRDKIETTKKEFNGKFDLFLVDYLHSKIYLNEKQVLITSINLKTYATEKNHEIGCLIDDPNFSKQIVNNIIIKKMLKKDKTEHINGKYSEWIKEVIHNGKIMDNDFNNLNTFSKDLNIEENKNDKPENKENITNETNTNEEVPENKDKGYCILCGEIITFNLSKPYCEKCESYFNNSNTGKYCHKCGTDKYRVSKYYPLCRSCYDKSNKIKQ